MLTHRRPISLPNMCGVLIRFCLYFIAVLEKVFLKIGVQEHERDVMRFLWYTDPTKPKKVEGNLSTYLFYLLSAVTLRFHLKSCNSPVAEAISDNIYVDNVCVATS